MGRNAVPSQDKNTDHTSRARDNKRRHRARQKEYVLDLERRLAVTREQGVQATKEVQLAAQRVTRENVKLRDLLRRTGYTNSAIDAWIRDDECLHGAERPRLVVESLAGEEAQNVTQACASQRFRKLDSPNVKRTEGTKASKKALEGEEYPTASAHVDLRSGSLEVSPTQVSAATSKSSSQQPQRLDKLGAPCKLVTLLAENPAADITQVSLSTISENQLCERNKPDNSDGIECSAAYDMLMRHATSGEKMDRIAAALESGCTPSATGGCSVKKSVVWRTLDQECT
jgi:hypothetical protein